MPSLGTITLAGKSGKPYKFRVYPKETSFKKGLAAVFVLTQRRKRESTGRMRHKPVFVGESNDLRLPDAKAATAMKETAANCICIHAEPCIEMRENIRQDLSRARRPSGDRQ